jgi:hypothetical protein
MAWSFGLVVPVRVEVGNCIFPNRDCGVSQVVLVSIMLGSNFDVFPFIGVRVEAIMTNMLCQVKS